MNDSYIFVRTAIPNKVPFQIVFCELPSFLPEEKTFCRSGFLFHPTHFSRSISITPAHISSIFSRCSTLTTNLDFAEKLHVGKTPITFSSFTEYIHDVKQKCSFLPHLSNGACSLLMLHFSGKLWAKSVMVLNSDDVPLSFSSVDILFVCGVSASTLSD